MKRVMVRYRVKRERVHEHERLVAAVFEALRAERPGGLRYAAFRLPDGVTFIHLVSHETSDGSNPLRELPAFRAFSAKIEERCDEPPMASPLVDAGMYEMFGE